MKLLGWGRRNRSLAPSAVKKIKRSQSLQRAVFETLEERQMLSFWAQASGTSLIHLDWSSDAVDDATYTIERSTGDPNANTDLSWSTSNINCDDQNLTAGTHYYYRLYIGEDLCDQADAATDPEPTYPPSPPSLFAPHNGEIDVNWWIPTNLDYSELWRSTDGFDWGSTPITSGSNTSWPDLDPLEPGRTYYYRVSDADGTSGSAFIVAPHFPSAKFNSDGTQDANGNAIVNEGDSLTFSFSNQDDPVTSPFTYSYDFHGCNGGDYWDFTDIPSSTKPYTFHNSGNVTVRGQISDSDGKHPDPYTASVIVSNIAPTADAGPDRTINQITEGDSVLLSGAFQDPGQGYESYSFHWQVAKGGQVVANGTTQDFNFYPTSAGVYTATFTVDDGNGGGQNSDSATITVNSFANIAPTFVLPQIVRAALGDTVNLSTTVNDPGYDPVHGLDDGFTYAWSLDPSDHLSSFSFTPTIPGAYDVTLTVTDSDGAATITSTTVVVNAPANYGSSPEIPISPSALTPTWDTPGLSRSVDALGGLAFGVVSDAGSGNEPLTVELRVDAFTRIGTNWVHLDRSEGDESHWEEAYHIDDLNSNIHNHVFYCWEDTVKPATTYYYRLTYLSDAGTEERISRIITPDSVSETTPTPSLVYSSSYLPPSVSVAWADQLGRQLGLGQTGSLIRSSDSPGNPTLLAAWDDLWLDFVRAVTYDGVHRLQRFWQDRWEWAPIADPYTLTVGAPFNATVTVAGINWNGDGTLGNVGTWALQSAAQGVALHGSELTYFHPGVSLDSGQALSFVDSTGEVGVNYTYSISTEADDENAGCCGDGQHSWGYSASANIVAPHPPSADFSASALSIDYGQPLTFSFSEQSDALPTTPEIYKYSYDLNGDGQFEIIDSSSSSLTAVCEPGNYNVRGRIKDTSTPAYFTDYQLPIAVSGIKASGAPFVEGGTISLSAVIPAAWTNPIYEWSATNAPGWDPASSDGASKDYTPTDDGDVLITLRVTADGGVDRTFTRVIHVDAAIPIVNITGAPSQSPKNVSLTLGSSVTDPFDLDEQAGFSYQWAVLRNGTAYSLPVGVSTTGASLTFTPSLAGQYTISLIATEQRDQDGSGTSSVTIMVPGVDIDSIAPVAALIPLNGTIPVDDHTVRWNEGDVFLSTTNGKILRFNAGGQLVETIDVDPSCSSNPQLERYMYSGLAFSSTGDLYGTMWHDNDSGPLGYGLDKIVGQLSPGGVGTAPAIQNLLIDRGDTGNQVFWDPDGIVFDAQGNLYVAGLTMRSDFGDVENIHHRGLYKLAPDGTVLGRYYADSDIQAIDLASDQHTLFFTHENWSDAGATISMLDLNTGISSTFWTETDPSLQNGRETLYTVRVLPDDAPYWPGGILASYAISDGNGNVIDDGIYLFDKTGQLQVVFDADAAKSPAERMSDTDGSQIWYSMALSPNGDSFWASGGDNGGTTTIYRFFLDGTTPPQPFAFDNIPNTNSGGLAVFHAATAHATAGQPYIKLNDFIHATDTNGLNLRYTLQGDTYGAVLDPLTGVFTWTPNQPGDYTFTVRASEITSGTPLYGQQGFTVHVAYDYSRNSPPALPTLPEGLSPAIEGREYTNRIQASDSNGDWLRYALVDASSGMTIQPFTGAIDWTPSAADAARGYRDITVKVTDPYGAWDAKTYRIRVHEPTVTSVAVDAVGRKMLRVRPVLGDPRALANCDVTWWLSDGFETHVKTSLSSGQDDAAFLDLSQYGTLPRYLVSTLRVTHNDTGVTEQFSFQTDLWQIPVEIQLDPTNSIVLTSTDLAGLPGGRTIKATLLNDAGDPVAFTSGSVSWQLNDGDAQILSTTDNTAQGWSQAQVHIPASPLDSTLTVSYGGLTAVTRILVRPGITAENSSITVPTVRVAEGSTFSGSAAFDIYIPSATTAADAAAAVSGQVLWGDGNTASAAVSASAAQQTGWWRIQLSASHVYPAQGVYALVFNCTDAQSGTILGTVTKTITIADAGTLFLVNQLISPNVNDYFGGELAILLDANSHDTSHNSVFSALVDWGDGSALQRIDASWDSVYNQYVFTAAGSAEHLYTRSGPMEIRITAYENYGDPVRQHLSGTSRCVIDVSSDTLEPPINLNWQQVATNTVELTWDQVDGASGYRVKRVAVADNQTTYYPTDSNHVTDTPYYDQILPGIQYRYYVQSIDSSQNASSWVEVSNSPVEIQELSKPEAVTGAHEIVRDPGTHALAEGVQLFWKNPSSGPMPYGYLVEREQSDSTWKSVLPGTMVINPGSTDAQGRISWFDTGAFETAAPYNDTASVHYYRITSFDADGYAYGQQTIEVERTNPPLPGPTGLQAAGYPEATQLTWDDRPADEIDWAGWNVYRWSDSESKWIKLNDELIYQFTGFNDETAPIGQQSIYCVSSVDYLGDETLLPDTPSDARAGRAPIIPHTRPHGGEPPAPTNLIAGHNTTSVQLSWNAVVPLQHLGRTGDLLLGYNVYRLGASGWTMLNASTGSITGTSFPDPSPPTQGILEYRVTAVDHDYDESNPSKIAEIFFGDGAPAAPALTEASHGETDPGYYVTLDWSASNTLTSLTLYRRGVDDEDFSAAPIHSFSNSDIAAGSGSWTDDSVTPGDHYVYRLLAHNANGINWTDLAFVYPVPPVVQLTRMGDRTNPKLITEDTPVYGIVDYSGSGLQTWSLTLASVAGNGATQQSWTGTTEMGHGPSSPAVLGIIDTTTLPSGLYELTLSATDSGGHELDAFTWIKFSKVGSLNLPFTDLQLDVPGGQSIVVRRVYDSSRASVDGDFGKGWFLDLSGSTPQTTATRSTELDSQNNVLRQGDLVYLNVPGLGQHVFEFVPKPTNYDPSQTWAMALGVYDTYWPQFVAVDGSTAKLTITDANGDAVSLMRSRDEFAVYPDGSNFDPNDASLGMVYHLTEADGTQYTMNSASGTLQSSQDANGNGTTFTNDGDKLTAGGYRVEVVRWNDGKVHYVNIYQGDTSTNPIKTLAYTYNAASGELGSFSGNGQNESYLYIGSGPYLLQKVNDASGVTVVTVQYDTNGQVTSLADIRGQSSSAAYGSFNGQSMSSAAADSHGNSVEQKADAYGNVIRQIQVVKDSNGNVLKYVVTVHDYVYITNEDYDPWAEGVSSVNKLVQQTDWQSFEILGDDDAGLRYTQRPTVLQHRVTYKTPDFSDAAFDVNDPDLWQPATDTILDANGNELTTHYGNYVLGKPGRVEDPYGNVTLSNYDSAGNLLSQTTVAGTPNAETTYYTYTDSSDGLPKGLLLDTFRLRSGGSYDNEYDRVYLSRNVYYTTTDAPSGAIAGKLESSTDAAGLTTRYTYAPDGDVQATYHEWRINREPFPLDGGPSSQASNTYPDSFSPPNAVCVVYPDATNNGQLWEQRFVYDYNSGDANYGRLIWETDPYVVWYGEEDNYTPTIATYIKYDDDGHILEKRRYKNVLIELQQNNSGAYYCVADTTIDVNSLTGDSNLLTVSMLQNYNVYDSTTDRLKQTIQVLGEDAVTGNPFAASTHTYYDVLGRVSVSIDQYGGKTLTTYDAYGHVISTLSPDGTETRSSYDVQGRVEWTSDRFASSTHYTFDSETGSVTITPTDFDSNSTYTVTRNMYDSLGRVIGTERYKDAKIGISADGSVSGALIANGPDANALQTAGKRLSTTSSFYDSAGRVAVSINADGLRTGTVYSASGQAIASGPMRSDLGSNDPVQSGQLVRALTTADLISYTTTSSDYNHVADLSPGGTIEVGDKFIVTVVSTTKKAVLTVTAGNGTAAPGSSLSFTKTNPSDKEVDVAVTAADASVASLCAAIAAAIGYLASSDAAFAYLTARNLDSSVRASTSVGHGLNITVDTTESNGYPADGQTFIRSYVRRDISVNVLSPSKRETTITEYDNLGRAVKTTYADGSFSETLYGGTGAWLAGGTDTDLADLVPSGTIEDGDRFLITAWGDDGSSSTLTYPASASSGDWSIGTLCAHIAAAINLQAGTDPLFAGITATSGNTAVHLVRASGLNITVATTESDGSPADDQSFTRQYEPLETALPGFHGLITGYEEVKIGERKAGEAVEATFYAYDAAGRLTDVWLPAVSNSGGSTLVHPHAQYTYDANGNITYQTDPRSIPTYFYYDLYNRKMATLTIRTYQFNPPSISEHWSYDAYGRLSTHIDFNGQTTWYIYDDTAVHGGRVKAEYRYSETFTPNKPDNMSTEEYAETTDYAEKTVYVYDDDPSLSSSGEQLKLGRLVEVQEYARDGSGTVNLTRSEHTTYDPITGNKASVASPEGTISYTYDPTSGRLIETCTANNETYYTYDDQGRLEHIYSAGVNGTAYATFENWDAQHRPVFDINGGTPLTTTYGYDAMGDLTSTLLPNGVEGDFSYDSLNRLYDEYVHAGSRGIFEQTFTLGSDGQRDSVLETRWNSDGTSSSSVRIDWTYDADGRLISETRDEGNNHYAASGENDYTAVYTLDLDGNIVQKVQTGYQAGTISYTYNYRNQLLSENGTTYTYDNDGNQITKTDSTGTTYYTWDLRGRLVSVTTPDGVTTTYGYDSDGQRVSEKTGTAAATYFVNDENNPTGNPQIAEEKTGSSPGTAVLARSYTIGLAVNGQADSNGVVYFLLDGHGSNRGLLSSGGNVVQAMDYAAYGDAVGFDPATVGTIHLFAGDGEFDRISKMYYRDARWGVGGRFISEDAQGYARVEDPITLNAYLYAGANPIRFGDPTGHWNFEETLAVAGTAAILTTALGLLTTSSVCYHINQSHSTLPDALAINIGVAGAYGGFTGGGTLTVMKYFKTGEWLYFLTGEGGLAPVSAFKTAQGLGWLLTFGFIWNMHDPSEMSGWGTTATWPLVLARFAIPSTLDAGRWGLIPRALAYYNSGVYAKRQGVIQLNQSSSGPAEIAGGAWTYSFGWTAGYSSTPRPIAALAGDVVDLVRRLIGYFGSTTLDTPPEAVESQMEAASSLASGS